MAAEVLGIIAAVGGLSSSLLSITTAISAFSGVNKEAKSVAIEVDTLYRVNISLELALESNKARPNEQWLSLTTQVIRGCTATVEELLRRIEGVGQKNKMSFAKKVSWSIKRSEVAAFCTQLRSYGQMLGSLQVTLIHVDIQDSQSSQRVETMLFETLLKLSELQHDFSRLQQTSSATYSAEAASSGSGNRYPGGLSQEAQEAMNATQYGSTRQPPGYESTIPEPRKWEVDGIDFKRGRLSEGLVYLASTHGIPTLNYKPSKMDSYELFWLLGNTTKAISNTKRDSDRESSISIKNVKLGSDSDPRSNLEIQCIKWEDPSEIATAIISVTSLLGKRPSEIEEEGKAWKWMLSKGVMVLGLLFVIWVSPPNLPAGIFICGITVFVVGLAVIAIHEQKD
ncbi:hypothetical protein BKA65DRAFT_485844 [Rhexocercosporidium sp. MPI-PUGE-AT-0058]|nr:hypothetical protein BKA65DRAFT_485844 [Rhexocercosporidium sp. MPI-PUGE-AT-0058]